MMAIKIEKKMYLDPFVYKHKKNKLFAVFLCILASVRAKPYTNLHPNPTLTLIGNVSTAAAVVNKAQKNQVGNETQRKIMETLLGPSLLPGSGQAEEPTSTLLKDAEIVVLYFSASW